MCAQSARLPYVNHESLVETLPRHITTLALTAWHVDVKHLARQPCLTSLRVEDFTRVTGFECISGITSLYLNSMGVSVAHLAPTLKQLSVWSYDYVEDIDQLTNLEVLELRGKVSDTFFEHCGQLPLKRLYIQYQDYIDEFMRQFDPPWSLLPTTLTHLTLGCHESTFPFEHISSLPKHITHLQLSLERASTLEEAVTTLPGLTSLDIVWRVHDYNDADNAFFLSNLTNLQSLSIYYPETDGAASGSGGGDDDGGGEPGAVAAADGLAESLSRVGYKLSLMSALAAAEGRGVKVDVTSDVKQVAATWSEFYDLSNMGTEWATVSGFA